MSSLALGALAFAGAVAAAPARELNLPAGSLDGALTALAAQTGDQLVYAPAMVAGRRVPALTGLHDTEDALGQLLGESDLVAIRVGPRLVVLKARTAAGPTPTATGATPPSVDSEQQAARPFGVEPAPAPAGAGAPPTPAEPDAASAHANVVETVQVTGTHIRGGSPAAPVVVLDSAALQATGQATIAGALQSLPQNFGGEGTEATVGVRADRLATNAGYGTGVNLRGLGSDATLLLVNGRRMAGSGNRGDFADLSSLPMIAVQRVEVLLDGASALYGSDAVGGVVNVILRHDLEGGEIRVRAGTGRHGPQEGLIGAVVGHAWSDGSIIAAYEGYRRTALPASARRFTESADLRRLGGTDWRDTFSYPGNITRTDPVTAASVAYWGIPAGQSGVGLKASDFQAGVINRGNQNVGLDVLPDQRRQSGYLAFRQDLGSRVEISGDARYAYRRVKAEGGGVISTLSVGRGNPFFVSPNNASSNQIQYSFIGEAGNPLTRVGVGSLATSLGASADLFGDWRAQAYGAFAQEIIETRQTGLLQSVVLAEALGNTADNPSTPYVASRDGFFNPYAAIPGTNGAATISAVSSGFAQTRYKSQVRSANLQADGALFDLPGGSVKLAVGGQARRETFGVTGSSYAFTATPVAVTPFTAHRDVVSAFAELRAPLVGPDNRRPGVESLSLSAALRAEHYSDFGKTVNPRVGLEWSPAEGVQLRATYGQSYRAPALVELYSRRVNGPVTLSVGDLRVRSLALQGGNPDLGPETATSWTVGFDLRPHALPGLKLSATWFDTVFDNRIDRPLSNARTTALTDPRLAPFVQRVSPTTSAADLAQINALLADPATTTAQGVLKATDFGAIIDQRYVNTAGLKVRGIDLEAAYSFDTLGGHVTAGGSGSWMLDYKQAITPASAFVEAAGLAGFPAKFRGRATVDWSRGQMGLGAAINHQSGFHDPAGPKIGSQTTLDLQARLSFAQGSRLAGTTLSLSIRNAFDKDPPFYDNVTGFGFDAASGDVVGRFVSVQLAKSW